MSIGPSIPSHLNAGPAVGPSKLSADNAESSDDDDYGPALPPDLAASRATPKVPAPAPAPAKRVVGPSFPTSQRDLEVHNDSDSDDDFGPRPLAAGSSYQEGDAVREFMEKEERRRNLVAEAAKPKKLQRDEWMVVPPTNSDLLGQLDTTKLKARQFARSAPAPAANATVGNLWTETPAERLERLADEVSGKKRRAVDIAKDEGEELEERKRRKRDDDIRKGVDEHTKKVRGSTLMDQHGASASSSAKDEKDLGIWDRDRDMSLGGRLMDDSKRDKMVREARGLGDRFGSGKSGGWL